MTGNGTPRSSLDRYIAAVAETGLRFTTRGDHVQAECPVHSDSRPSLSADWMPAEGRVLFTCQANCDPEDVREALGVTWPMLHDDYEDPDAFAARRARDREEERQTGRRPRQPTKSHRRPAGGRRRPALPKGRLPKRLTTVEPRPLGGWSVITTYDYCDLMGVMIHQEVRHERPVEIADAVTGLTRQTTEKRFTQRWPDDQGGWQDKTPAGFVPVLYQLPAVAEAIGAGRRIWLCEGAKDADRFLALGEAATTNPSGAGNFKAKQADALAGAHVVAVLDHDLAGYRRGLTLAELLTEVASLRLVLPATGGRHQDASDHLDAGHGLSDFVDVTSEGLAQLEQVAEAEEAALLAGQAAAEAQARAALAQTATSPDRRDQETRYAARWAAETGKLLARAVAAVETAVLVGPLAEDLEQRLLAAVTACQTLVGESHQGAGVEIPEELEGYLAEPTFTPPATAPVKGRGRTTEGGTAGAGEDVEELGEVIEHPTAARLPEPSFRIPSPRRVAFAYEKGGEGRRLRGIYMGTDGRWERVSPLPYVKARIIRRDGSGRQTGTFYLVSVEENGPTVLIGPDELRSNSWTNTLDLPISQHAEILTAASSALVLHGSEAPALEATPRMSDDGRVELPHPDTMPPGYLAANDLDRETALGIWREILTLAAENPRFALVLGAAAVAPFIGGLRQQAHVLAIYGDPMQGKTTTLSAAAAIWGTPRGEDGAGVLLSWNATNLSVPAFLGDLGVLPAFMDEIGQAGDMKESQWHQLISNITQGAVRMTRARNKPGVQLGLGWRGIFFSSGNGQMGHGAAGKNSGIPRRLVELHTPFTNSKEHGEAIEDLIPVASGHVGNEILERHSVETVRPLIARASAALGGGYATSHEVAMAEHLAAHLAGAQILDDLCGTGGVLFAAAALAAAEFLDECAPPPHDADRVYDAVMDAMIAEPGSWPSLEDYQESKRPKPDFGPDHEGRTRLPQHGLNRTVLGVTFGHDRTGQEMVGVLPKAWKELCRELEIEPAVACRELEARGLLWRNDYARRNKEWASRHRGVGGNVYALVLQGEDPASTPLEEMEPPQTPPHIPLGPAGSPSAAGPPPDGAVPGPPPPCSGSVPGAFRVPEEPLTCDVPGVPGVPGEPSRVEAPAREIHFPAPHVPPTEAGGTPEVLIKLPEPRPCTVCGEPAGYAIDGAPVHAGECADPVGAAPSQVESSVEAPPANPGPRRGGREARFTAPAACLDGDGIHLADGSVRPWPAIAHLGDLALLTGREELRLGWGGGEDRLPDQGQVWLYAAALERLGLPASQPALPDKALTKAQRARETGKIFARLDGHPMVAGAVEAGWQFGQGGHLDVWTRIWHRDLLPQGALIVGLPWHRIEGVSFFDGDPYPGELARRLLLFAQRVGVAYRITTAATGLDLIDHHRPPRRSVEDDRGQSRRRVSLVRRTPAELPAWRMKTSDARFTGLEQDFSWWRPWEKLPEGEKAKRYVHGYDRNASYLVPWRSLELGVEDLIHRAGGAAAWDGKEKPGYYLVDADWEWPHWGLPDPGSAAGALVGKGRAWVTVHTLRQLAAHDIHPAVHESYTWGLTARYLEGPGIALAEARTALTASAEQDPGARAVLDAVKALYSSTVGKLAEREHHADFHLWRPDWRDHVIGATKTAILHTLTKAQEISGAHPLVVDRDAVFYASDDPDPVTAWPGDPAKLGRALGSWKPIGATDLATWGPRHLPVRAGRWHYADAVAPLGLTPLTAPPPHDAQAAQDVMSQSGEELTSA